MKLRVLKKFYPSRPPHDIPSRSEKVIQQFVKGKWVDVPEVLECLYDEK